MKPFQDILVKLPYRKPFLFVDEIIAVTEEGITGTYFFDERMEFYKGHFIGNPVTPGVLLIETMAQIGVVALGIFLLNNDFNKTNTIAFTSTEIEFLKPVFPNEKVTVVSQKIYFRFGKLKCKVVMFNSQNQEVCSGYISGIIK